MRVTRFCAFFGAGLCGLLLIGCGGNSSNSALSGGAGGGFQNQGLGLAGAQANAQKTAVSDTLSVFITDSTSSDRAVWVKLHKISLDTSKQSYPIFESTEGEWIDVRSLHEKSGNRYMFMGAAGPLVGEPVRAKVELGGEARIGAGGEKLDIHPIVGAENGKANFVVNLNPRGTKAGPYGLVLDFQSKRVSLDSDKKVKFAIHESEGAALTDPNRQIRKEFVGNIGSISGTAPSLAISLDLGGNKFVRVSTDSTTQFGGNGQTPTLIQGMKLRVRADFNVTTKVLDAKVVDVMDSKETSNASLVYGYAADKPDENGDWVLNFTEAQGFDPAAAAAKVGLDEKIVLQDASGKAMTKETLLGSIQSGARLKAEGKWNDHEGRFDATRITLLGGGNPAEKKTEPAPATTPAETNAQSGVVVVSGKASQLKANEGLIELVIESSEGWTQADKSATAVVDSETKFFDAAGQSIDREKFFSEAKIENPMLEVKGTLAKDGRIAALLVTIKK